MITEFHHAESVEEAISLCKKGYTYLAGGTQINNGAYHAWSRKSATDGDALGEKEIKVVSLNRLNLSEIKVQEKTLKIGALTILQNLCQNADVPLALRQSAEFIPTRNIRNMATIGGNIGANRGDSYIIPVLIALDAELEIVKEENQKTRVKCEAYVSEHMKHLITAVIIPDTDVPAFAVKESRSHVSPALVSAAVSLDIDESGAIRGAKVAAGCNSEHVIRLKELETCIVNGADNYEEVIRESISPSGDTLGSVEYKKYLNAVIIADAVRTCKKRAGV